MPVQVEIHREGRAVLQTYLDPLDMREVIEKHDWIVKQVLDHATKPVHSITDMRTLSRLPSNILSQGLSAISTVHPMGGEIILVTTNAFLNTMANVFKKAVRKYNVSLFQTMDEAWAYVDKLLASEPGVVSNPQNAQHPDSNQNA
jgi:hypothetical protein